jgi:hypothetical protein
MMSNPARFDTGLSSLWPAGAINHQRFDNRGLTFISEKEFHRDADNASKN